METKTFPLTRKRILNFTFLLTLCALTAYFIPSRYQLTNLAKPAVLPTVIDNAPTKDKDQPTPTLSAVLGEQNSNQNQSQTDLTQQFIEIKGNLGTLGQLIQKNGKFYLAKNVITNENIQWHTIRDNDLANNSVTSRIIKDHTIQSEDLSDKIELDYLTVNKKLSTDKIDLGRSTIIDGELRGDWSITGGLTVAGILKLSSLAGSGNRCVYADSTGTLKVKTEDCDSLGGSDNLGNHILTQNLITGNHYLSGDGDNEGIFIDTQGNVGIGTTAPASLFQAGGVVYNTYDTYDTSPLNANLTAYSLNPTAWGGAGAFRILINSAGAGDSTNAVYGEANVTNTGFNYGTIAGGDFEVYHSGSGTITSAYGLSTYVDNDGGTISNAAGIHIWGNYSSSGEIVNNYGLLIADQTAGTNNWNIWSGPAASEFNAITQSNWIGPSNKISNVFTTTSAENAVIGVGEVDQGWTYGGQFLGSLKGSANDLWAGGLYGEARVYATGTGYTAEGIGAGIINYGAGVIDLGAAIHIGTNGNVTTGTITNNYGLLIDDQTAGTNNWAIKTGLGDVQFGDESVLPAFLQRWTGGRVLITATSSDWTALGIEAVANEGIYLAQVGSPSASSVYGMDSEVYAGANGQNIYGMYTYIGTGAFTNINAYGLSVGSPDVSDGGSIVNSYGLSISDQTAGTNNYAIHTNESAGVNNYALYNTGTAKSYFAGNIGIGTTNPGAKLEINSGSAGVTGMKLTQVTSGSSAGAGNGKVLGLDANGNIILVTDQTGTGTSLPTGTLAGQTLYYNGSNWVTNVNLFNNGGNVGIGTTNPLGKLDVYGMANIRGNDTPYALGLAYNPAQYSTDSWFLGVTDNNGVESGGIFQIVNPNGDPVIAMNYGGNVGIGTTNPAYKLTVIGDEMISGHSAVGSLVNPSSDIILNINDAYLGTGEAVGLQVDQDIGATNANNLSRAWGGYITLNHNGSGTIGEAYVLEVSAPSTLTNGHITNLYGLSISNTTGPNIANAWNLYSDGANSRNYFAGNIGIGTTNPTSNLYVQGSSGYTDITIKETDATGASELDLYAGGYYGTIFQNGESAASTSLDTLAKSTSLAAQGSLILKTYMNDPIIFATNGSAFSNEKMRITSSGNVGIGTTAPTQKLTVAGNINVVGGSFIDDGTTLNVPDYVFEPGYNLKSLPDLETYINQNLHLPNVPSQDQIKKTGMNYGSMIMSLLEKTEENTLYTISNYHQINGLTDKNVSLDDKLNIISQNLTNLNTQTQDFAYLSDRQASLQDQIKNQTKDLTELQTQMDELKLQTKPIIDFYLALDLKDMLTKDTLGNVTLLEGKITAKDIEALNTFKAKDIEATDTVTGDLLSGNSLELGKDTSGKSILKAGEVGVEIDTIFANKDAKIYITPVGNTFGQVLYIDEISDGKYFNVKMNEKQIYDINFNWLIVK